jgi:hypothetical protein
VANKFLNDVRMALTGPPDDQTTFEMSAIAAKDPQTSLIATRNKGFKKPCDNDLYHQFFGEPIGRSQMEKSCHFC